MTSFRFPQIEVLDCIRQLIYVRNQAQWSQIAAANPDWQLGTRSVYSLNGISRRNNEAGTPIRDSDNNLIPQPYAEQPFVPPAPEGEDNTTLIKPVLFDNPTEMFIQATTQDIPLTATYAQYRYSSTAGILPDSATGTIGTMAIECYLWVLNQDAAQSRMLRYFNWFDYALRFNREAALSASENYPDYQGINQRTQFNLYRYVSRLRRTGPAEPVSSGLESIRRQAGIGILVAAELEYINGPNLPHDL